MAHPSEIVIRLVEPRDAEMLQRHCFVRDTAEQTAARIEADLQGYADGEMVPLVAEVEGAAVGNAVLQRKRHPLYHHRAELVDMVVGADYQRRGIARRLIEALRDRGAGLGVTILETSVRGGTPAEQVYRRVGFQEYGRLPGGIAETWGEHSVYDEVFFWMPVK